MNFSDQENLMITRTGDGSNTLYSQRFGQHYHSLFGAVTESDHIFIRNGYHQVAARPIKIFEMGFGTGLNAILTSIEAYHCQIPTFYKAIDLFPIENKHLRFIHNNLATSDIVMKFLDKFSDLVLNNPLIIHPWFEILVQKQDILEYNFTREFDLVFYDAFSPEKQPELWTGQVFSKIYNTLSSQGLLLTYCSKGSVKQSLRQAGFRVQRLEGPPGKRHIVKAIKE